MLLSSGALETNGWRVAGLVIGADIHFGKCCMNSGRASFDGDGGVKGSNSHLEWFEANVFVREDTKLPSFAYVEDNTTG